MQVWERAWKPGQGGAMASALVVVVVAAHVLAMLLQVTPRAPATQIMSSRFYILYSYIAQ